METIQHAAIKTKTGEIFTAKKHNDISHHDIEDSAGYGFLTSEGRYVCRQEAADIAYESGQISAEHFELINGVGLISENLWEYGGFKYEDRVGYYKE